MLLKKYGKFSGYDAQHIPDKQCYSCKGTGDYYGWGDIEVCYKCAGTGVFRDQYWTILERYKFGKYTFHQPLKKVYKKPDINISIEGYVSHRYSNIGGRCVMLLYLLFDIKYFFSIFESRIKILWHRKTNWIRKIKMPTISKYELEDELPF
jgi:hypothetical protein